MRGYLIHRDLALQGELSKVMPGAAWRTWEPKHQGGARKGIIAATAAKIAEHLKGLPETVGRVSTRQLKVALGLTEVHANTLTAALREAMSLVPWRMEGRSISRISFA